MVQERIRLTSEGRRTAILDAAQHEFARKGFRGAGTADIAARCGCSEPMLYKHFASKQELFAAVLTHAGALMGQRVDALLDESGDSVMAALVEVAEHVAWLWVGFTLSCGFRHALEPEAALEDSPFVARTFVPMLSPDNNAEEAE